MYKCYQNDLLCFIAKTKLELDKAKECMVFTDIVEAPTTSFELINGQYVIGDEVLSILKTIKKQEINDVYESKANIVKIDVPESEVSTWYIQETEATEWNKDNKLPTPFIDGLSTARKVDRLELIQKILYKVTAYKMFMGSLTGQRQYYEDLIDKATTKKEVENIIWQN